MYLGFKDIGAPVDVIVTDLKRYGQLKEDSYLIYSEVAKNGKLIYEKSWKSQKIVEKSKKQYGSGESGQSFTRNTS